MLVKLQTYFKRIINLCFTRKDRSKLGVITEIILLIFVFSASSFIATKNFDYSYKHDYIPVWYQTEAGPAVSVACGKGYKNPVDHNPNSQFSKFLNIGWKDLSFNEFNPRDFPTDKTVGLSTFQKLHRYMFTTIGLWWRLTGNISWTGIIPLSGIFYGITCLFAYLIFRLGMGRLLSLCGVSAFTLFSPALAYISLFRDFTRAPFILAFCYLLILIVTIPFKTRNIIILSFLAGLVAGGSLGFRTDLLVLIPLLFVAIFFFSRTGVFKNLKTKFVAVILFLVIFIACGWPILKTMQQEDAKSAMAHCMLLGFMEPNNETLHVASDTYNWGLTVADMYAYTFVGSQAYHRHHKIVGYYAQGGQGAKEYHDAVNECITDIALNFPADMLTRIYATIFNLQNISYNPYAYFSKNILLYFHPQILKAVEIRDSIMFSRLNIGFISIVLALLAISFFDLKKAIFFFLFGGVLLSYPTFQFQPRHFFMLSFVGLWSVGFMLYFTGRLIRLWIKHPHQFKILLTRFNWMKPWGNRHVRKMLWFGFAVIMIFTVPWLLTAAYQNHHLHRMFYERILTMEKQPLELKFEPYNKQNDLILITSPQLDPAIVKKGLPANIPFYSEFILVEFDCHDLDSDVRVTSGVSYDSQIKPNNLSMNITKDFTQIKYLEFKKGERKVLIMPVYYTDKSNFNGVLLEKKYQGIVKGIYKFSYPQQMPVSVMAFLPLDYCDEFLLRHFTP